MNKKFTRIILFSAIIFSLNGARVYSQVENSQISDNAPVVLDVQDQTVAIDLLEYTSVDVKEVLRDIEIKSGLKIVFDENIAGPVTIYLKNVDVHDVLRIVLEMNALAYYEDNGTVYVVTGAVYESKFGHSFKDKIQTKVVSLSYADPLDVVKVLTQVKTENGKIIYNVERKFLVLLDSLDAVNSMTALIEALDVSIETRTIILKNKKVADVAEKIKSKLTQTVGKIQVDLLANSFVVTDKVSNLKMIEEYAGKIDGTTSTVLFDVKILRIILNDEHEEGVDWDAIVSDYQKLALSNPRRDEMVDRLQILSIGTLGDEDFAVLQDALDTVGVISTISKVKETAMINAQAKIDVKLMEVVFNDEQHRSQQEVFESQDAIKLQLTPTFFEDDTLLVKIKPQLMETTRGIRSSSRNDQAEDMDQKTIDVKVHSGSTIVIGSYFKDMSIESIQKIPLLGDLPFLGFVFRNQGQSVKKTEVVVFITTTILPEE